MTQYSQSPLRAAIGSHTMFEHMYGNHTRQFSNERSDMDAYDPLYIDEDDLSALRDSTNIQGYHLDDEGRFLASHEPPPPPLSAHAAVGVAVASPVVEKPIGQPAFLSPSVFMKERTATVQDLSPEGRPRASVSKGSRSSRSAEAEMSTRPTVEDTTMTDVTSISPPPSTSKHPDAIQLYDWYIAFQPAVNVRQYSLQADEGLSHWVQVAGKRYRTRDGRPGSPSNKGDGCELWHSSLIAARISSRLVRTKSGGLYQLVGPPDEGMMRDRKGLSYQFVVGFQNGFPHTWNKIVEREAKRLGLTKGPEQKRRKVGRPRKSVVKQEQVEEQLAPPLPTRGQRKDKRKHAVSDETSRFDDDDDDDWQPMPSEERRRRSVLNRQDDSDADEEDVEVVSPARRRARKSTRRSSNDDRSGEMGPSVQKSQRSKRPSQLDKEECDFVPPAGLSSSSPPRPRPKAKKLPRELLALSQTGLGRLVVVENAIMDSLEERRASLREQGRLSKRQSLPAHLTRENPQTPLSQVGMNSLHTPRSSSRKRTSAGRWWEVAPLKAKALSKKADVGEQEKQPEKAPSPDPTPTRKERQAKRVTPEAYVTSDLSDHFSDSSDAYQAHDTDSQSDDDEVVKTSTPPRSKKRGSTSPNTDPVKRPRKHSRMFEDLIDDEESEGESKEAEGEEEPETDQDEGSEAHHRQAESEGVSANVRGASEDRAHETALDLELDVDQIGEELAFADDHEPASEVQREASREAEAFFEDVGSDGPNLDAPSSSHEDEVEKAPQIVSLSTAPVDADSPLGGTLGEDSDANEWTTGRHSTDLLDAGLRQEDAVLDDGVFDTIGHEAGPEMDSHAVASHDTGLEHDSDREEHILIGEGAEEATPQKTSTDEDITTDGMANEQFTLDHTGLGDARTILQDERVSENSHAIEESGSVDGHEDGAAEYVEPADVAHEADALVRVADEGDESARQHLPIVTPAQSEPVEEVVESADMQTVTCQLQPESEGVARTQSDELLALEDVAANVTGLTLKDDPTDLPVAEQRVEQRHKTASPVLDSLDDEGDDEIFHDVSEDFVQVSESPVKLAINAVDINMLAEEKVQLQNDAPEVQFLNSVDSHSSIEFHKPSTPLKHADFDTNDRWLEVESESDSYEDESDAESEHFARDTYYFSD